MTQSILEAKNLEVSIEGKKIISGLNLKIGKKEIHAIMGPNGSGKSTLAKTLLGYPKYSVKGKILFNKKDITSMKTDERARLGIFLAFQHPVEIEGLSFSHLLYNITEKKNMKEFKRKLKENLKIMSMPNEESFVQRDFNIGYSGGERKKAEMLQMLLMRPKLAIIDEIDSGLDIDSLKVVANAINKLNKKGTTILLITHYARILKYVKPDYVHIMKNGNIIKSGDKRLAQEIERTGYK